jgi:hypothetical protein
MSKSKDNKLIISYNINRKKIDRSFTNYLTSIDHIMQLFYNIDFMIKNQP